MPDPYTLLEDRRTGRIGSPHWLGNLRWFAEETGVNSFTFRTAPANPGECEFFQPGDSIPSARRTLLSLNLEALGTICECAYRCDEIVIKTSDARIRLSMPLEAYGAVLEVELFPGIQSRPILLHNALRSGRLPFGESSFSGTVQGDTMTWRDGMYLIAFQCCEMFSPQDHDSFFVEVKSGKPLRLALTFGVIAESVVEQSLALYHDREGLRNESRSGWNRYLASCPVQIPSDVIVIEDSAGGASFAPEVVKVRQYWHWHGLLSNVYELPFNNLGAFVAPDKALWFGCWSNDGPECLRALSCTAFSGLARKCIVEYIRTAINDDGDLSWYLHATGEACLGKPGDSGRLSHGVPAIVAATASYIRATGDTGILSEAAGSGGTVWQKIKHYLHAVFPHRDINGDGLVEWVNLWEGGPDDKVGCFFSEVGLAAWIEAVTTLNDEDLAIFYQRNSRPVTNLYEQRFFLEALGEFAWMAEIQGEPTEVTFARERLDQITKVISERHWDEGDGFFYDWDVRRGRLVRSMNQDAFYLSRFLEAPDRSARLFAHLENTEEFALMHTPTLARNATGFQPEGYWSGGHWPREAHYIAEALVASGFTEKALELLLKAVCSEPGKILRETLNPLTGEPTTATTMMAYNVLSAQTLAALLRDCLRGRGGAMCADGASTFSQIHRSEIPT